MKLLFLVASVLACAGTCWGQSEALNSRNRSIFSRYAPGDVGPTPPVGGSTGTAPAPLPVPVFVGVILTDDHYTGFLMTGDTTQPVAVGDMVAGSRVVQVTMDGMRLANGTVIAVGYDLQNHLAPFNAGANAPRTAQPFLRNGPNTANGPRNAPRLFRGN